MQAFSFYRLLTILALREASLPLRVTVQLEQGSLQGIELTSVQDNRPYVGFLGIPYAKPPVGQLRFKAPQPPEPWKGTLYAVRNAAQCVQKFPFAFQVKVTGSEDCLFLNVYTPKLPSSPEDDLLPVMVWIHGGSFEFGSGDKKTYGPDYLIVQGVLVVTINYRVGPLGFLSFEDAAAPGNAGLKDQVAALRWVQKNIALFGGDPKRVTIFGESAGAASVHLHLMSPMSKGLFHKAISQSGTALNSWSITTEARKRSTMFAETFGCGSDDTRAMVDCLRNVSAIDILEFSHNNTLTEEDERHGIIVPFLPTPEYVVGGDEEVFLPGLPAALLSAGKFHNVPHIIGVNSHEAILLARTFSSIAALEAIDADHNSLIPPDLLVQEGQKPFLAQRIKHFYFGNKNISKETVPNFVDLLTDMWFTKDIRRSVQIQANISSEPVYFYQFSYNGKLGFMKRIVSGGKLPGACHGDDLGYLFRLGFWPRVLGPETPEMITLHRMVKMWTNFAKTGARHWLYRNPTSELDAKLNITWEPVTATKEAFLSIDNDLSMRENLEVKRMAFWDELYSETEWLP